MKTDWKEKSVKDKIFDVISAIATVCAIVMITMKFMNIGPASDLGIIFSLCITCICQANTFWNTNRGLSYFTIIAAALLLTGGILELFV